MIRGLGKLLMVLGSAAFATALAWWIVYYHELLGDNMKQASACFYSSPIECDVGSLAGFFVDVPVYDPVLLWVAAGLGGVGLVVYAIAPGH